MPWLAESWEVNDDATEFTFHLRDDVTFSDGTPFTADVVKANFDDIIANGAKANGALAGVHRLRRDRRRRPADRDRHVLRTRTPRSCRRRRPSALGFVAPSTLALPFEERATAGLVGTGPFTLDLVHQGQPRSCSPSAPATRGRPTARANDGEAYLDEIVFTIIPEASVRTGALQSGQVAVIGGVPPQDIAEPARTPASARRHGPTPASCSGSARS